MKKPELKHLICVYGSLLTDLGNHMVLGRHVITGDAKLLGEDLTEASYSMVNLHAFPGLLEGGDSKIFIEVYKVSDLALRSVRMLEGYREDDNGMYKERPVTTKFGEGTIYIYNNHRSMFDLMVADESNVINWKTYKTT